MIKGVFKLDTNIEQREYFINIKDLKEFQEYNRARIKEVWIFKEQGLITKLIEHYKLNKGSSELGGEIKYEM